MELFPRNYENVQTGTVCPESVKMAGNGMRMTGTAVVPDYENIETADLLYENEVVWKKKNQSYKYVKGVPLNIKIADSQFRGTKVPNCGYVPNLTLSVRFEHTNFMIIVLVTLSVPSANIN